MLTALTLVLLVLDPAPAFNQGNQLYAHKDYAGAIAAYERSLAAGPSAPAHYNLANALFKSGRIGDAILHYRRARYLAPRDADVLANLAFARSYRVDKTLSITSPPARVVDETFHFLSRREATTLAAVLALLASVLLGGWILRRWALLLGGAVATAVLALFCLATQQVWAGDVSARPAVVVVPEVSAASGPGEEFKQILLLHDGTEVRIREQRGDYLLVQLPGGSGGWIKQAAVRRVYGPER